MNPHARMPGYLTQPFCGKHCCHTLPQRKTRTYGRVAKRSIKRKEAIQWRKEFNDQ